MHGTIQDFYMIYNKDKQKHKNWQIQLFTDYADDQKKNIVSSCKKTFGIVNLNKQNTDKLLNEKLWDKEKKIRLMTGNCKDN